MPRKRAQSFLSNTRSTNSNNYQTQQYQPQHNSNNYHQPCNTTNYHQQQTSPTNTFHQNSPNAYQQQCNSPNYHPNSPSGSFQTASPHVQTNMFPQYPAGGFDSGNFQGSFDVCFFSLHLSMIIYKI